jgi:hypothetical protein
MPSRTNIAGRNVAVNALATALGGGTLRFYTGAQPGSSSDAATGTLLATITLPGTAFATAANGTAAKSGTWSTTATTGGTPGWARFVGGSVQHDVEVGASGEITFDNYNWVLGGTVTVNTYSLSIAE